jgi:hypothetical protein
MGRIRKYDYQLASQLAAKHGLKPQTVIAAWRDGREVTDSRSTGASASRTLDINLHLAVLASAADGRTLTCDIIGEVCGCDGESIRTIEQKALKKLRKLKHFKRELR